MASPDQRLVLSNRLYVPRHLVTEDQLRRFRYYVGPDDDQEEVQNWREYSDTYGFGRGNLAKLREVFDLSGLDDQRASVPWPRTDSIRFVGILEDDQERVFREMRQQPYGLVKAPPRYGKASPHGTGVLTPTGWRAIETLEVGDLVIGRNGRPTRVTGVFRRGVIPINRVTFSDGASVQVGDDHLWSVRRRGARDGEYVTMETQELARHGLADGDGRARWQIPLVEPVRFKKRRHRIDPYLLGALLGAGRTDAIPDAEAVRAAVEPVLPPGTFLQKDDIGNSARWVIRSRRPADPLRRELMRLGLADVEASTSFVPESYLFSSVDDRLALLRGLMDTGGEYPTVGAGTVTFWSTSERLRAAVVFLVQSLGGVATEPNRPSGWTRLKLPPGINPFRAHAAQYAPRKEPKPIRTIRSIEPCGEAEAVCISVDAEDHLYVTEECIVTHNTVVMAAFIAAARQRALVLVNRIELAEQLLETFEEFTDLKDVEHRTRERLIGISTPKRRDFPLVTIATYQQFINVNGYVWLKRNRDAFGLVLVDEAHMAKAEWFSKIVGLTNPKIRMGVTATPYDSRYRTHVVVHDLLGPVVAVGRSIDWPTDYQVVDTRRMFDQFSDWGRYVTALCRDEKRNRIIASWVARDVDDGRYCLVTTDRIDHAHALADAIRQHRPGTTVAVVTGATSKPARRALRLQARAGEYEVVVAMNQIVQLGYNVPRWSVLHNTCPLTSPENWYQRLSRVRTRYFADEARKFGAYDKPRGLIRVYRDECPGSMQRAYLRMVTNEGTAHRLRRLPDAYMARLAPQPTLGVQHVDE